MADIEIKEVGGSEMKKKLARAKVMAASKNMSPQKDDPASIRKKKRSGWQDPKDNPYNSGLLSYDFSRFNTTLTEETGQP